MDKTMGKNSEKFLVLLVELILCFIVDHLIFPPYFFFFLLCGGIFLLFLALAGLSNPAGPYPNPIPNPEGQT